MVYTAFTCYMRGSIPIACSNAALLRDMVAWLACMSAYVLGAACKVTAVFPVTINQATLRMHADECIWQPHRGRVWGRVVAHLVAPRCSPPSVHVPG